MCVAFVTGLVAKAAREPLFSFDEDESMKTAISISNVGQYYNVSISPVAQAWLALGMTVSTIYAGKIAAVKINRKMKREQAKAETPVDVASEENSSDIPQFLRPMGGTNLN